MAAQPTKPADGGPDRGKMLTILVPAVGVGLLVILVAVMASVGSGAGRPMSDGSDGSEADPGLKEISPGVKIREVKEGTGDPCPPGAKVKIKYTGWLTNGTVFDSNKSGIEFDLNGLIKGWQEGIPGMKPGGIRKLVIASDKGYGPKGSGGKIPGNATLIFEVELISAAGGKVGGGGGEVRPRGERPFDLNKLSDGTAPGAEDPNLKELAGGLKYRDLKEGDGDVVPHGARVRVDYIGWLTNGTKFDSSWDHGDPIEFGLNEVVKGWGEGIPGMKVGGVRKLVIPAALGYQNQRKGSIPPNSTLIFEVHVLGVKPE